jgi:uncharacterized protein YndB with AHSA1/START domain
MVAGISDGGALDRIERAVTLDAPVRVVWDAVTESGRLSEWFGADVELDPRPGGRAAFRWKGGRERGAVVEEVSPPSRLSFRWLPFDRAPDGAVRIRRSTRVEFIVEELREGARLTVTESPLTGTGPPDVLGFPAEDAEADLELSAIRADFRLPRDP